MSPKPRSPVRDGDSLVELAQRTAKATPDAAIVVLDRDLRIRHVNAAYEDVSLHRHEDIVGEKLFEVFPDDPRDVQANGSARVHRSIDIALRTRGTDTMPIYRYDVRDPEDPDTFVPRLWTTSHTSVHDRDGQYGVLERVEPITTYDDALNALSRALAGGEAIGAAEHLHLLSALADTMRDQHLRIQAMTAQADQLSRAVETRDIIGQAKGVLMERYDIGADAAFRLLRKLSQDSNIKLAVVATRLIDADHRDD